MQETDSSLFPIAPRQIRYIKLGTNNAWFADCRRLNRIVFGHRAISHELAQSGDRKGIVEVYARAGRTVSKASDYAREVLDFYTLGADCLWVTFAEGALWWGFADPEVQRFEDGPPETGSRYRQMAVPWSNLDAHGKPLVIGALSTRLTKVAAYRQTICQVEAANYLVRRINAVEEPAVLEARKVQDALLSATRTLIAGLHWHDFEVLCDLIFARSGWQRVGELGGLQKDTDLVIEQVATGERAFVQIKSASDQAVLSDYVARFEADPAYARMFFICHTPRSTLSATSAKPIHIWAGDTIARQAVAAGLFDWLIDKAG